jgi:hypothetical protein
MDSMQSRPAVRALPRQRQAGQHPATVHVDRTSAALPLVAAFLGAGQPGVLPQGVEQRYAWLDREAVLRAIDAQNDFENVTCADRCHGGHLLER